MYHQIGMHNHITNLQFFIYVIVRYYRSGLEMVRMANVYYDEGNLESAYCLYLKFMTLFLEKIRGHPDFAKVPPDMKTANQKKIKEVLPKAEKLKQKLLEVYKKDYDLYMGKIVSLIWLFSGWYKV